jgi:hypothetical protein
MKKPFSAFLMCIMVIGLILGAIANLCTVYAETSIPKPSVPEFTVKLVDTSYTEPTTYSIDPYTGEKLTHAGSYVERTSLEVKIKNQPFTANKDADGLSFFYNIRVKGHFSEDWIELYRASDGYPTQSDSEYTVISLGTLGENGLSLGSGTVALSIPLGGKADFQVEAMIGCVSRVYDPDATNQFGMYPWRFTGETSGWSNTQTLTIDVNSGGGSEQSQVDPNETSVPNQQLGAQSAVTQPDINWTEISLIAALVTISAMLIIALVYKRKVFSKVNTLT